MRFSVITPSFRSSDWLKLCIPSVADQTVKLEHIVQDSCSDDGTQEWLPKDERVRAFVEKDKGMYDAVNRGLRRAAGDVLSYLNCDEQYLPGALLKVQQYFEANPKVEVVFADTVIVDANGDYICHRQASLPGKYHTLVSSNLSVFTCSTFFRRSVIDLYGLFFNAALKDLGDADWARRLLEKGTKMGLLGEFTSAFADTGMNMNLLPNARREERQMFESAPVWARRAKRIIILHYRLRRLLSGHYRRMAPFSYAIYTKASPKARVLKNAAKPTYRWRR